MKRLNIQIAKTAPKPRNSTSDMYLMSGYTINYRPLPQTIKLEIETATRPVVPSYPKDPSAHKDPKTVQRAVNKYLGGLSNVLLYM
jgi:hypothetical protein